MIIKQQLTIDTITIIIIILLLIIIISSSSTEDPRGPRGGQGRPSLEQGGYLILCNMIIVYHMIWSIVTWCNSVCVIVY